MNRQFNVACLGNGGDRHVSRWAIDTVPNCDFFAFGEDHRVILAHIFDAMPCRVFELYSSFDAELAEFHSLADVERRFSITDWSLGQHETLHLQIYADGAGGRIDFRRIAIDPRRCDGATFRYSSEGWGLIQLYLESPVTGSLRNSHTNHNSEKRAVKWADTYPEMESVSSWDWSVVNAFSRKLNRFIRKCAVDKQGSRVILPCAAEFMAAR